MMLDGADAIFARGSNRLYGCARKMPTPVALSRSPTT
jgi:hypothetical protein